MGSSSSKGVGTTGDKKSIIISARPPQPPLHHTVLQHIIQKQHMLCRLRLTTVDYLCPNHQRQLGKFSPPAGNLGRPQGQSSCLKTQILQHLVAAFSLRSPHITLPVLPVIQITFIELWHSNSVDQWSCFCSLCCL